MSFSRWGKKEEEKNEDKGGKRKRGKEKLRKIT